MQMQSAGKLGAQREAKLKVCVFSKNAAPDAAPVVRMLSRKDLLDEINAQAQAGAAMFTYPPSPARQQSTTHNLIKPRDIRKVDPAFATRLEPAILVRWGCVIVSLGRSELRAIITREQLYCVLPPGNTSVADRVIEQVISALHGNLAALRAASEADTAESQATTASSAALTGATPNGSVLDSPSLKPAPGVIPRSSSDPALSTLGSPLHMLGLSLGHGTPPMPTAQAAGSYFEFCALEAVLMTACSELSRRQAALTETLQRALLALRRNVTGARVVAGARQLDNVRMLKQQVRELLVQSQALEEVLREVLDEDEDMEAMYLTRRCFAVVESMADRDHEEVEMLLESYLQASRRGRPLPSESF